MKRDAAKRVAVVMATQPLYVVAVRSMAQFVGGERKYNGLLAPFKEIMQTLEKPPAGEGAGLPTRKAPGPPGRHLNSPPRSADYYNKGNKVFFFHHLGGGSRKG